FALELADLKASPSDIVLQLLDRDLVLVLLDDFARVGVDDDPELRRFGCSALRHPYLSPLLVVGAALRRRLSVNLSSHIEAQATPPCEPTRKLKRLSLPARLRKRRQSGSNPVITPCCPLALGVGT